MDKLLEFVWEVLAAWRLTLLITQEEGPFSIAANLRDRYPKGWVGRGIRCVWCVGFWAGLLVAGGSLRRRLAVAASVGILHGIIPEDWLP